MNFDALAEEVIDNEYDGMMDGLHFISTLEQDETQLEPEDMADDVEDGAELSARVERCSGAKRLAGLKSCLLPTHQPDNVHGKLLQQSHL